MTTESGNKPFFDPSNVDAVVFDIGGVFCYPACMPVAEWMESAGLDAPEDLQVFREAHHVGVRALHEAPIEVDETSANFWSHYDRAYSQVVGIPEEQTGAASIAMRNKWDWLHDENIVAFHDLAATDIPLAIVSNNDGSAPQQMKDFGVCQVGEGPLPTVAAIVDSALVGIAKPDPAIFTPALDALGIAPERVLYVGDTIAADVIGATAAGMQVVQLDPFDTHASYEHPRCADIAALNQLLDV